MPINKTILEGRLTQDPELHYTQAGKPYCRFGVAVNGYGDKVSYFDCVAWDKLASDVIAPHTTQGQAVVIEGELQQNIWETQSGEKQSAVSITVRNIVFFNKPKNANAKKKESKTEAGTEAQGTLAGGW